MLYMCGKSCTVSREYLHSIYTGAAGAVRAVPGRVDPADDDHVRGERAAAAQAEGRVQDHAARLHGHQHQQQSSPINPIS